MLEYSGKRVVWHIEEKPEGGFLARCDNPAQTLEAPTREEIQAKVREKLKDLMGPAGADLDFSKLPLDRPGTVLKLPVKAKFSFSLGEPNAEKPMNFQAQLQGGSPSAIEPTGGSLISALWKAAVLVGIAVVIWLLLNRR